MHSYAWEEPGLEDRRVVCCSVRLRAFQVEGDHLQKREAECDVAA